MNKSSSYLDISLMKNQNMIAAKLAFSFSIDELEKIDISAISFVGSRRDISKQTNVVYSTQFHRDGEVHTFEILDIFLLNEYPISRYINIRFTRGGYFQMDYKCRYTKKVTIYLKYILAKAINFAKYRSEHDFFIIKGNIYNNFAKLLSNAISLDGLEELRFVTEYISNEEDILAKENFTHEFSIEGVLFCITTTNCLIKIWFKVENQREHSIYLYKTKIGLSSISLIVEKAIKFKLNK